MLIRANNLLKHRHLFKTYVIVMIQTHYTYPGIETVIFNTLSKFKSDIQRPKKRITVRKYQEKSGEFVKTSEQLINVLSFYYQNAHELDPATAQQALPHLKDVQEMVWYIKGLLNENDFFGNQELKTITQKLVRLTNRLYSRVQSIAFSDNKPVDDPLDQHKNNLVHASQNVVLNAIKEGENN